MSSKIDWARSGQDKALVFDGKNMLVSASAGSGKTTVMVEKIRRYLVNGGSLSRLIVVTFTRASAADMREKLEKEIRELVRKGGEEAARYRKELRNLPLAYIGTIDSLCAEIYKRYFEDVNRSPVFAVLDEDEARALRREAMEQTAEEYLAEGNEDFAEMAKYYADGRDFEGLYAAIGSVMDFLSVQEDPDGFLERAAATAAKPFDESPGVEYLRKSYVRKFARLAPRAERARECAKLIPEAKVKAALAVIDAAAEGVNVVLHADSTRRFYTAIHSYVQQSGFPSRSVRYTAEQCDALAEARAYVNAVKDLFKEASSVFGEYEEAAALERGVASGAERLISAVRRVTEVYAAMKEERESLDFADVERFALKILSNPERAKELRDGTDYIFFDEYQDTNRLQEAIIGAVAKDNLFMVGDVKQSIYRFRHAEPQIFLDRYRRYEGREQGSNVPLNMNFRSSQAILEFIDKVFSVLMTYDFGGLDYGSTSRFNKAGIDFKGMGDEAQISVAVFTKEEEEETELAEVYSVREAPAPPERRDKEAEYISSEIRRLIASVKIPDKESGEMRNMRYSDIAVLVRKHDSAANIAEAFGRYGIPYDFSRPDPAAFTRDLKAIISMIKVIDNPSDDHALAAAMLSPFGGFAEDELAAISDEGEGEYFYERVRSHTGVYAARVKEFNERVSRYRKLSALTDVSSLIARIATETGFLAGLLADGEYERIDMFNAYVKYLQNKEAAKDVTKFLKFSETPFKPPAKSGDDCVRFMTIHASKGLEFPVVFLARAGGGFVNTDKFDSVILDPELGIGVKSYDEDTRASDKPLSRKAIELKNANENKLEELRLLYVATTRARFRLYVTGTRGTRDGWGAEYPEKCNSYLALLDYAAANDPSLKKYFIFDPEAGALPSEEKRRRGIYTLDGGEKITYYEYPFAESAEISNKYTVTALNSVAESDSEGESVSEQYVPSLGSVDTETGILYHKIMELIDFGACSLDGVKTQLGAMARAGVDVSGADAEKIAEAVQNPLFDGARTGKTLREREFIYYAPAREILRDCTSEDKTLLQGVIDLIILSEEGNVLVDYKVTNASADTVRARYGEQVRLYARVFEEITGLRLARKAVFILNRNEVVDF